MGSWLGSGTSFRGFASDEPAPWGVSELALREFGAATAGRTERKGTTDVGLAVKFHRQHFTPSINPLPALPFLIPIPQLPSPIPKHPSHPDAERADIPRKATRAVLVADSIVALIAGFRLVGFRWGGDDGGRYCRGERVWCCCGETGGRCGFWKLTLSANLSEVITASVIGWAGVGGLVVRAGSVVATERRRGWRRDASDRVFCFRVVDLLGQAHIIRAAYGMAVLSFIPCHIDHDHLIHEGRKLRPITPRTPWYPKKKTKLLKAG